MDFDKSKILTVVTADQAKVGQKGWFDNTLAGLKKKVANSQPQRLIEVQSDVTCSAVFIGESGLALGLFYPAPEPTYRPFKNAEEFKPYRDEWFRVKNGGGFDSVRYYDNDGVKDSTGNFITYQKLFEAGERENGEPCGVKEES